MAEENEKFRNRLLLIYCFNCMGLIVNYGGYHFMDEDRKEFITILNLYEHINVF